MARTNCRSFRYLFATVAALALAAAELPAQAQTSTGICDRSEQAQQEILSHIPKVNDCAKVSDSHLSGITRMTVAQTKGPFALQAGDFDGLANLESLVMVYPDSTRTMPDGIFDGLTNLTQLKLTFFAGPDTLPDDIFDELENLTFLHLRIDEDLDSLPDGVFDELTELKYLSVRFKAGPTELPEGVFDELTELEWLIVRNKTPMDLSDGAFDELANLEKLEWIHGLTSLPDGVFDELTNLEELNLSRNYLTSLPDGVFDELTNLEELNLSRNYLTSLPDGVFDELTNLEELNLSRNAISSMPDELFDDLPEHTNLTVDRQKRKSPPDYPTRGRPVINGVAQVGQTLTVSTSGMSDQNGMTGATFEYRWYTHPYRLGFQGVSGYDEGDTYAVGPDDEGKRILVKVKYTDDAGNRESIKSARTAPVAPPPDEVMPPTSPQYPEFYYGSADRDEATVSWGSPIYDGGSPITGYRIEWIEAHGSWDDPAFVQASVSESPSEWSPTVWWRYEFAGLQPCVSYRVRVIASNIAGDGNASAEPMPEAPYPLELTTPNLVEAVVNYAALTLTYDEVLHQGLVPPASAFTVTVEETRRTVDTVAVEGQSVTLTLADVVTSADAVTVGYTNPAGTADGCIVGTAVGLAPSFGDWPATNNTGATDRLHGPPPPKNLRAVAVGGAVRLSWEAPDGAAVTGYRIDRRHSGSGRSAGRVLVEDTGSADTAYTDESPVPGVAYEYRVRARNEAGPGEASGWVGAAPQEEEPEEEEQQEEEPVLGDGPPGAPGKLTVTAGDREVTLSWEPPEDNGNAPAETYRVEWRKDGQDYDEEHWSTTRGTTYTKTHLANGIGYTFWVTAQNGNGHGPRSEEVGGTPTSGSAVDLGTPVLSKAEWLHHGMVRLDWGDVDDAGWYVVQYYYIEPGGGAWVDLPAVGVDIAFGGSGAVVSNMDGRLSWFRVRAASCAGSSEWSEIEEMFGTRASDWEDVPVPAVQAGDEPEPCPEVPGTPDNSPATGAPTISGTARVAETLTAHTGGIADDNGLGNATFTYQWQADGSDIPAAAGNTHTLAGADEGRVIKVRVSFTDDEGNDETLTSAATGAVAAPVVAAPAVAAPEPPARPTGLSADVVSHNSVTLTWDNPQDDAITGYVILRRDKAIHPEGTFAEITANTASAATTYTDDTAEPSHKYVYRIKAINTAGASDISSWVRAYTLPAPPAGLVSEASHNSVTLRWDDPGDDTITGYVILRRDKAIHPQGTFQTIQADTATAATTYTDDTAQPDRRYVYRIKAINTHGTSNISSWVRAYTSTAP